MSPITPTGRAMVRPETVGKSVVGRIEKLPGRPNLRLVPDEPRDVVEDAADAAYREAMRPVAEAYTRALNLFPSEHPAYELTREAARAARECAGLPPLESALDALEESASG